MKQNVTIKDIAKIAGVSTAVVSVALSKGRSNARMSPRTRERIRAIAEEYNYQPNITARGFHCRKSYLIGFFFNCLNSGYILMRMMKELRMFCYQHDYDIILYPISSLEMERHSIKSARARNLDAVLTIPFADETGNNLEYYRQFLADGIPVIQLLYQLSPEFDYIGRNYNSVGIQAIKTLHQAGHKRIGLIIFDNYVDEQLGRNSHQLYHGCRREANQCGVELTVYPVQSGNPDCSYPVENIAEQILSLPEKVRPTALIGSTNKLTYKIYGSLKEANLRIPENISLLGCADDMEQNGSLLPDLSYMKIPFADLAQAAGKEALKTDSHSNVRSQLFTSSISGMKTIHTITNKKTCKRR